MVEFLFLQFTALIVLCPLLMAAPVALLPGNSAFMRTLAWLLALIATGGGLAAALFGLLVHHVILGLEPPTGTIVYALGGWPVPWGIAFIADGASLLTAVVVLALGFVATLYARAVIAHEIEAALIPRAYAAWLLAIGGLAGTVMTGDMFNLFVFVEIASLATVTLIGLGGSRDRRALIAAYNYLIIGAIGATFYVIGVGFCYAMTGTLNMADMAERLPDAVAATPIFVGFAFMVAGVLVKAAVFPVHVWLPAAYGYAPSAVSAMLAAVATKASLYVLGRIVFGIFAPLPGMTEVLMTWVILPLSLLAIFAGTILAIMESDLKKLLAQSSVAQIGYITLGFSLMTAPGVAAGFVHMVNHAMIKGGLFMGAGALAVMWRRRISIESLSGMGRAAPITSAAILVCALSLMGLPLTAGFISKVQLVLALLQDSHPLITGLVMLSSALSLIYIWRIIEPMWMREPQKRVAENPALYIPLWLLALGNLYFGVDAQQVVGLAEIAAGAFGFDAEAPDAVFAASGGGR